MLRITSAEHLMEVARGPHRVFVALDEHHLDLQQVKLPSYDNFSSGDIVGMVSLRTLRSTCADFLGA